MTVFGDAPPWNQRGFKAALPNIFTVCRQSDCPRDYPFDVLNADSRLVEFDKQGEFGYNTIAYAPR